MATDQPTPPDLGNLSDAEFRALPDWSVLATNIAGKDDTFASMEDCVVALVYRELVENFAYINLAFRCEVDTPLSIAAKAATEDSIHWTPTDFPAQGLTIFSLIGVNPVPGILFSCNGTKVDNVSGILKLNPPSPGTSIVWANIISQGARGSDRPKYGVRTHAGRWVYVDDNAIVKSEDIAYQATYALPEWPQDTVEPIVLAKVADFNSSVDVGVNNRIGFEFGLGAAPVSDPNSNPRDYCLYLRWYDIGNVEQLVVATLPTSGGGTTFLDAEPISVTPGRRVTLGFHRYDSGGGVWVTRFYINGLDVSREVGALTVPNISSSADLRLHIGSAQLGKSYTGGPINNVLVWANPDPINVASSMLTAYLRGEGFEQAP